MHELQRNLSVALSLRWDDATLIAQCNVLSFQCQVAHKSAKLILEKDPLPTIKLELYLINFAMQTYRAVLTKIQREKEGKALN